MPALVLVALRELLDEADSAFLGVLEKLQSGARMDAVG